MQSISSMNHTVRFIPVMKDTIEIASVKKIQFMSSMSHTVSFISIMKDSVVIVSVKKIL